MRLLSLLALTLSLLLQLFAVQAAAAEKLTYSVTVGEYGVTLLSEAQRLNDVSILIGASSEDIREFIPGGQYPSAVNAFLVRTPKANVLVDTGFGRELFNNLQEVGLDAGAIDHLLITHSHGDHIGGLVKDGKPLFPKAVVHVSQREYDWSQNLRDMLKAYENRFVLFDTDGPQIDNVDGIASMPAYGHTPGHTLFLVESQGERLLIWGDLTHAMAIQIPRPDISVTYDSDPREAAASRKKVLEFVAGQKIPVAGMHIAYPGMGHIEADPQKPGSYTFKPLSD